MIFQLGLICSDKQKFIVQVKKSFRDFKSWGSVLSWLCILVGVDFDIKIGEIVDVNLMVNFIMIWFRISMCMFGDYSIIDVVIEYNILDIYRMNF